ncbi:MAG: rhodanese-like domain-containing protein [Bacteroidales bacterium]|nr:rhodanese-like domain-containing protein [Bacteroidales bacterium]
MKIRLIILLCLFLVSNVIRAQVHDSLKYISVGPAGFQEALHGDDKPLLIDVRNFWVQKSRIDNAVNIPSSANLDNYADTLNKDYTLFLYCTSGFRSKRVAKHFYDRGFLKLYSLDGGSMHGGKKGTR